VDTKEVYSIIRRGMTAVDKTTLACLFQLSLGGEKSVFHFFRYCCSFQYFARYILLDYDLNFAEVKL